MPFHTGDRGLAETGGWCRARKHDLHINAEWFEFECKRFRKRIHRGLARRIDRQKRQRLHGDRRRDIDDQPRPSFAELRKHGLHHAHGADRVGLEDIADDIDRRAFERVQPADAGIVDKDVDRAGRFDSPCDAFIASDVEGENAQVFGYRQQVLTRRAHSRDYIPAAIEKQFCDIEAETRRAAGDENSLHGCSFHVVWS
ncbi:hypothetical protein D3C73_900640 [compost metagenome]